MSWSAMPAELSTSVPGGLPGGIGGRDLSGGSGSSKPLEEESGESSALTDGGIVTFVERGSEPVAVVSGDFSEGRGQPLGVRPDTPERDDRETVADEFQRLQERPIVVPARPEILTPEVLVSDLVRDEGLELLGVEKIEGRLRDQDDRTSVQSHGGLGNLDDLEYVCRLASVQLEDAPRGGELPSLGFIEVADVAFRRQLRENALPLHRVHGSGANGIEPVDDSRSVMSGEEAESGFQHGAVLGRDGRRG
jgi:hypothetical protein